MPLWQPIQRFFVDDTLKSLELREDETRSVTYRLPESYVDWLKERAEAERSSPNQVLREIIADLTTWFRVPLVVADRIERNRHAMQLDRRAYAQHLLWRRSSVIVAESFEGGAEAREAIATARERAKDESGMGPPLAIRLADDHIRWIDQQAATYHLSSAAFVRLMIEDHANWFSIPPTMAALLARELEQMKLGYRNYMQFVLIERDKQIGTKGTAYEAHSFRFPTSSRYNVRSAEPRPEQSKSRKK